MKLQFHQLHDKEHNGISQMFGNEVCIFLKGCQARCCWELEDLSRFARKSNFFLHSSRSSSCVRGVSERAERALPQLRAQPAGAPGSSPGDRLPLPAQTATDLNFKAAHSAGGELGPAARGFSALMRDLFFDLAGSNVAEISLPAERRRYLGNSVVF